MRVLLSCALLLVSFATSAAAQIRLERDTMPLIGHEERALTAADQVPSHPCDVTPLPQTTIQGNGKLGICFNGKDVDGNAITGPFVFKVYVDKDTTPTFTATLTASGPPNAAGYSFYETVSRSWPQGLHELRTTVSVGALEGLPSLPFAYTGVTAPPGSAVILRLVK